MNLDEEVIAGMINKGKLNEAELLVKEALRKNKTNGKAWYLRGLISLNRGEFDFAIEAINLAMSFNYYTDFCLRVLGYAHLNRGDFEEAASYFKKIKEKSVDDYFMIATAYILLKDPKSAREYLSIAYEKDAKRTKELLLEFYKTFIMPANELTEKEKKFLLDRINSLKG